MQAVRVHQTAALYSQQHEFRIQVLHQKRICASRDANRRHLRSFFYRLFNT